MRERQREEKRGGEEAVESEDMAVNSVRSGVGEKSDGTRE